MTAPLVDEIERAPDEADLLAEVARQDRQERDRRNSSSLPALRSLTDALINTKLVRDYARAVLVEPALKRLYDIGMGSQTFEVPLGDGTTKQLAAPASVQTRALMGIIAIGVPAQLGLVDGNDETLPGIFALGPLELDAARQLAHGDRYMAPPVAIVEAPLASMDERVAAGEFEMVEQDETAVMAAAAEDTAPPAELPAADTPEQAILARRRARTRRS